MTTARSLLVAASLGGMLLVGCADPVVESGPPAAGQKPQDVDGPFETEVHEQRSRGDMYVVRLAYGADPVPFNEMFALDIWVLDGADGATPLDDAAVGVKAWMPAHGHGMSRFPRTTPMGDGRYRVRGMLLHMRGHWEVFVDVTHDGLSSRATFELDLP